MNIAPVTSAQLPYIWPMVMEYIQQPLEYEAGELTPEKIFDHIDTGVFILLVVWDGNTIIAAQTCEIIDSPRGRVMNLPTTGGKDIEKWQDELADMLDKIAAEQGCISIRTRGRIGWFKKLKRNGYKPLYFIAEKRI